jgi:tetratricopeptide (TPR) repeat protein
LVLQQYSLIVTQESSNGLLIRFHPLVHAWAHDQLSLTSSEGEEVYRAAAIRLIICSSGVHHQHLHQYLKIHIDGFSQAGQWQKLHLNARAALAEILLRLSPSRAIQLWKALNEELARFYGKGHIKLARAMKNLAYAYRDVGLLDEATPIAEEMVEIRKKVDGMRNHDTLASASFLADLYTRQKRFVEGEKLQKEVSQLGHEVLGPEHRDTIISSSRLAILNYYLGHYDDAIRLHTEVYQLLKNNQGERHRDTLIALGWLGLEYYSKAHSKGNRGNTEDYHQAERFQSECLQLTREALGNRHPHAATTMYNLSRTYHQLRRLEEALKLAEEAEAVRKELLGVKHKDYEDTVKLVTLIRQEITSKSRKNQVRDTSEGPGEDEDGDAISNVLSIPLPTPDAHYPIRMPTA